MSGYKKYEVETSSEAPVKPLTFSLSPAGRERGEGSLFRV
jgi:hypothetical protein